MPPKYTRTFADVYLAELDYVKKLRDKMGLDSKAVDTELENVRQKISRQDEVKRHSEVKPNVRSWLYKLFNGESEDAPSLNIKASTQAGLVGLALSGGGVRSATFKLGLLQSLAKNKVLQYCDYLSTVSGGGYIGSCLSALLANAPQASTKADQFPLSNQPDGKLEERAEVNHLRMTKNYLGTGSMFSWDSWHIIGSVVSGTVPMSIVLVAFISLIFLSYLYLFSNSYIVLRNILIGLAFIACIIMMLIHFFHQLWRSTTYESRIQRGKRIAFWAGIVSVLVIAILLIQFLSYLLFSLNEDNTGPILYILAASLLVVIIGPFIPYNDKFQRKFIRIIVFIALSVLFLILTVWIFNYLSQVISFYYDYEDRLIIVFLVIGVVTLVIKLFFNLNRSSLYYFYRDRLSNTYIIKRKDDQTNIETDEFLELKNLQKHYNGPYHLINATLNVPNSNNSDLKGRGADFFIFSKYYCGAESTGYRCTENYDDGKTELAAAMAISGAAVSSRMGSNPIKSVLMSLLNIRLNLWMQNPNRKQLPKIILWPVYLYRELFRKSMENDALLNLSDGGHHENLGIYSLLKRRCSVIIASDAGADPKFQMEDLANLQRKARIDLGINIDMDLTALRLNQDRNSEAYYVKGIIQYPDNERGTLFYIKATMKGDEPEDLLAYRRKNARFPDETTADQFFNEEQFESYRKLGELVGENLCSTSDIDKQISHYQ